MGYNDRRRLFFLIKSVIRHYHSAMITHLSRYDIQLIQSGIVNLHTIVEKHMNGASSGSVIHAKWDRLVEYIDAACDELHINRQVPLGHAYASSSVHTFLRAVDGRCTSYVLKILISVYWRLTDICSDILAPSSAGEAVSRL